MKKKFNKDKLIKDSSFLESKVWLDEDANIYWNDIPENLDLDKFYEKEYWSSYRKNKEKGGVYQFFLKNYKSIRRLLNITPNLFFSNYILYFKYLNQKSKILEIGCGAGENIIELSKKKYSITGVELDKKNVARINNLIGSNVVIQGNYEEIVVEGKFDFIYLNQVMEHFRDLYKVIKKLKKNLNSDGCIYISVPNADSSKYLEESINNHPHIYHFTMQGLEVFFINNGFTVESIGYYDWKRGSRIMNDIIFSLFKLSGLRKHSNESEYLIGVFKLDKH